MLLFGQQSLDDDASAPTTHLSGKKKNILKTIDTHSKEHKNILALLHGADNSENTNLK